MTVDDFYTDLPADEKMIAAILRELVLQSTPDFTEKFAYGVPYYFRYSRVLCIWPASAPGGPRQGVFLGLCRGHLMSNEQGLIEMGNRKQFGLIRFKSPSAIKRETLAEIIQESILVDEEIRNQKKRRIR